MAKRSKNAIALFEVITATKRREAEAEQRQSVGRPKRWFSGRGKGADYQEVDPTSDAYVAASLPSMHAAAAQPSTPPAPVPEPVPAPVTAAPVVYAAPQAVAPAPVTEVVMPQVAPPAPVEPVRVAQRAAEPATVEASPFQNFGAALPWRSWLGFDAAKKVAIDPERKEVTLRFRYTTAVIATFAVMVALGLAYVSGRKSNPDTAGTSPSTRDVQGGPILAGVLDPERGSVATLDTPEVIPGRPEPVTSGAQVRPNAAARMGGAGGSTAVQKQAPGRGPAGVQADLPRVIGLNYVIVQSYEHKKDAEAACQALQDGGIPCTVEPVPPGWSTNPNIRFSVVGVHGFPRTMTLPQYRQYIARINEVSKRFAGKSKIKQFEPIGRKWK